MNCVKFQISNYKFQINANIQSQMTQTRPSPSPSPHRGEGEGEGKNFKYVWLRFICDLVLEIWYFEQCKNNFLSKESMGAAANH